MMQAMNAHILIASDDQSFGMKMRDAIEREGIPAVDMPRTLAAQTISPHQLPSAVIIDVGAESDPDFFPLLARLQADPRMANIPSIVYTANALAVPIAGECVTVLDKSCAIADVIAVMKRLLAPVHNDAHADGGTDLAYMDILLTEARAGARSLYELIANRDSVKPLYRYVDEALATLQTEINHLARQRDEKRQVYMIESTDGAQESVLSSSARRARRAT